SSTDMLVNDSSSNASVPALPPDNSSSGVSFHCHTTAPSSFIFIAIDINIIVLMLPLSIFILHYGVQQWLQRRSASAAAISHSDCFTYHMVVMELLGVFGYILNLAGICRGDVYIIRIGDFFTSLTWFGQVFFHSLTCLERYLAVVHPIVYLRLKNERGIRIRNVSIACAWALSVAGVENLFTIMDSCLLITAIVIVSFCSLSVLCVLIRPGPGDQSSDNEKVDQLKKRAFYTIMAILGVLVLRFTWGLTRSIFYMSKANYYCLVMTSCFWFYLPSSLVLPLLFLHRTGKLMCCKKNMDGKQRSTK
uniref:G-protein coupled receptors family 1 profile domain-containing protein n=1 Tax=Poecilia formosa TaxID=48698 RepID=A0A096LQK9_POEFO